MSDGRPEEASVKDGVKLSRGPLDGVEADNAPDGAAVRNVPLIDPRCQRSLKRSDEEAYSRT